MENKNNPIDWTNQVLNTKSKSFCGAKWYNATVWLGNGMTSSCHHPPPHKIDPTEVVNNPSAIHNTHYKKLVRKQMQEGIQTKECEYCWKIENLDKEYVSDRYYKSSIYSEADLDSAFSSHWSTDIPLQTLEISFDNNCNFACSYCNAGFSTTWAHDINKNGAYQNLKSDGWGAFGHNGDWAKPYGVKNEGNPYTQAFWKWWESTLQYSLRELRVTGGEATLSNDFWKLVEWFENNPDCKVELAINTNLGTKKSNIDRLCNLSKHKNIKIFTSNESYGKHAEYIRDGLIWEEWLDNFEYLLANGKFSLVHSMLTINALCLGSLDKFLEKIFDIREKYLNNTNVDMSFNILRFPSFQSITVLPDHIKSERAIHYKEWLKNNSHRMKNYEIDGMNRTIGYIEEVKVGHSVRNYSDIEIRQYDFYNFFNQYDTRRNKNFYETFSDFPGLNQWFDTLKNDNINKIDNLISGDATKWGEPIFLEVLQEYERNQHDEE